MTFDNAAENMKKRLCILLFAVVFLTLSAVAENCHRHITAAEGDMTFSANMKKVQWTFDSEAENKNIMSGARANILYSLKFFLLGCKKSGVLCVYRA